jgi:hypothetical protein
MLVLFPAFAAPQDRKAGEGKRFWSFQPVADPAPPSVLKADWPRNAIDRFVLAKLEDRGLAPVADADRRTLLRRAAYDLIGLPPTPAEIDAFLADPAPDAFARVVDRLLASPHYGERWGRHWMDVIRYADTAGDNSDYPIPQMYRYRNYIIDSFNRDKPFDLFIREQIAGDLMPHDGEPQRLERIIATGYIANARRFGSTVNDYPTHLTIEDTLENLSRTFFGLGLSCTRCHNHKFDPLTMEDYYGLYGFFQSTRYPWPGIELDKVPHDFVPLVPPAVAEAHQKKLDEKKAADDAAAKKRDAEKADLAAEIKAAEKAPAKQGEDPAARKEALDALRKRLAEIDKAIATAKKQREAEAKMPPPYEVAYAVAEGRKCENAKLQMRGDPGKTAHEVPRRFIASLGGQPLSADVKGSGRLELAGWIADHANPLTARVLVNRLWQHHFGRGIVQTPNDFGKQGRPPTHPELLDWLARRFVEAGWSIKAMHRLIMGSRTYQLSSRVDAANAAIDPADDLLWRARRRRLDAEAVRDTLLDLGGNLDRTPGGAHPFPDQTKWDYTQHKPFKAVYETPRRSVYLMTQRVSRHPFLAIFDGADTNSSTGARVSTTSPLQALFFMNDPFVHDQARRFAARLASEAPDEASRIDRAYALALGRPPSESDRSAAAAFLKEVAAKGEDAWESFVRVLLRTNEFIYVN